MSEPTGPGDGFSEALPYTADTVGLAPAASGVHVVRDSVGAPIYVGATSDLRGRLRQHLSGDRRASVLHEQVGAELDGPDHLATAQEIADWLGGCTVAWRLSEDPEELKAQLVAEWQPRFNRRTEQPRSGISGHPPGTATPNTSTST
ncbi:GIY-YIG nuclease family protein [Geodermatophilus sp. URMC 64]